MWGRWIARGKHEGFAKGRRVARDRHGERPRRKVAVSHCRGTAGRFSELGGAGVLNWARKDAKMPGRDSPKALGKACAKTSLLAESVVEATDEEANAEDEDGLPALVFEVETDDRLLIVEQRIPN